MSEERYPPAIDGTEMRLDAVIARLDRICDLLTPPEPQPAPEPADGETVELREPEKPKPARKRG